MSSEQTKDVGFDLPDAIILWLEANGHSSDDFEYRFEDGAVGPLRGVDVRVRVPVPSEPEDPDSAEVEGGPKGDSPKEVTARCVCAIVDGTCAQCLRAAARGDDMGDL